MWICLITWIVSQTLLPKFNACFDYYLSTFYQRKLLLSTDFNNTITTSGERQTVVKAGIAAYNNKLYVIPWNDWRKTRKSLVSLFYSQCENETGGQYGFFRFLIHFSHCIHRRRMRTYQHTAYAVLHRYEIFCGLRKGDAAVDFEIDMDFVSPQRCERVHNRIAWLSCVFGSTDDPLEVRRILRIWFWQYILSTSCILPYPKLSFARFGWL
jgi:hypothetical protein